VILATTLPTHLGRGPCRQRIAETHWFQEWGPVVQRRASQEPIDNGGWNIFHTYLGGFGNVSLAPNVGIRGNGRGLV
jgi:hypothetical protein